MYLYGIIKTMNREIKFRAWDNKEKKWLLGYEYPNLGGFSMFGECMLFEEWSGILNRFILQQKDRVEGDLKLMQFTGLHDKSGVDIYDGDILDDNKPWVVIQFDGGAWGLDYANGAGQKYLYPLNSHIKIIGNIYNNPELLTP
jgi:hypothetical protein